MSGNIDILLYNLFDSEVIFNGIKDFKNKRRIISVTQRNESKRIFGKDFLLPCYTVFYV